MNTQSKVNPKKSQYHLTGEKKVLLVFGLPNSGKTTLCEKIIEQLVPGEYVYFNADKVRSTLSKDLKFSTEDRMEQARRMGCMASLVLDGSAAKLAIIDFVNPNIDTWSVFRDNLNRPVGKPKKTDINRTPGSALEDSAFPCFSVFMNTIENADCVFADTAEIFARGDRPVDLTFQWLEGEEDFKAAANEVVSRL
jgi:GTPase SAR1 family protein